MFKMPNYLEPDFTQDKFVNAPNAVLMAAPIDKVSVLILVDVHVIDHGVDVLVEKRVDCQRGSLDLRAGKGLQRVL